MIPQSFIQDLLGRVDIVDVIEAAVPLKRAGSNMVACCPFHSEKSPSFTVSPSKQFYHCFGCGAHGTAISFLMEFHGMGFVDAVRDLAGRVGLTVPEAPRTDEQAAADRVAPTLVDILARAARFYKEQLKRSEPAIRYLKSRGLTGEIAAKFGLGYAPDGWHALSGVFGDYDMAELLAAGLVIDNDEGRRYDRFRDRIMFPIVSQRGEIIGFGGRVLGTGEPKYLNSPETPIFEKGRELYGLFQARQAIRQANRVVVVEGYMDVVALAQHGVTNVVATLGTATTPVHVQKLLRQADRLTFCFDGDSAGRRAAWRALEVSLEALADGKQIQFMFLPEKEDPDSFVRSQGSTAFGELVENAEPLSRFLIRELCSRVDMKTPEGKAAFLKDAEALIGRIRARNLHRTMRDAVEQVAGVALEGVPEPVAHGEPAGRAPKGRSAGRRAGSRVLEDTALRALVGQPGLYSMAVHAADLAPHSDRWDIVRELASRLEAGELAATPAALFQHLEDTGRGDVASELQRWLLELGDDHDFAAELEGTVAKLEDQHRRRLWDEIARGVKTVGDLTPEARELISGAGRP
ncbi:MAG: DNA primase [Betaproteobacteria bacterium]|nr:DNA primase [Betaproteobacteria bacterium]